MTRTTRSVAPSEAGEGLLHTIGPRFEEIESELAAVSELREKPAGTVRITATDYAVEAILWPKLTRFLRRYPDVKVEIIIDYGLTDIVTVRNGEQVARDMIAVRIGPDMRMAVVGAPSYFKGRSEPRRPQELIGHNCINLRLPTRGGLYAWEFEKDGRELKVHVEGQLVFNGTFQMLNAALSGFGLAYVPEDVAAPISRRVASTACSRIGALCIRVTTSITRAAPADAGIQLACRRTPLPDAYVRLGATPVVRARWQRRQLRIEGSSSEPGTKRMI